MYIADPFKDNRVRVTIVLASLGSAAVGVAAGYFLAKKRNERAFNRVIGQIQSLETTPEGIQMSFVFDKIGQPSQEELEAFAEQAGEAKREALTALGVYSGDDVEETVRIVPLDRGDEVEITTVTVVAEADMDWDYEQELSTRSEDRPYVIHKDEYFGDEFGNRQETMTYYAGDDIMADPLDTIIPNYAKLMGELKFGHGSGAPDVVYIRNEKEGMEWEVLLEQGYYMVEVLGHTMEKQADEEIRHSQAVLKFRRD